MYLKLTFVDREGNTVIRLKLIAHVALADMKRFWEAERAVNELTKGRLHIDVEEDVDDNPAA